MRQTQHQSTRGISTFGHHLIWVHSVLFAQKDDSDQEDGGSIWGENPAAPQTWTQSFSLRGCSNTAHNVKYMKFTFVLIWITWYGNKLKHWTTTLKHYHDTQLEQLGQLVGGSTMAVAKFNSNAVWNHSSLHMLCYISWVTHWVHGTLLWSGGSSSIDITPE